MSGPLATPRLTGTRVHGLSAVPVKRRCGQLIGTETMIDLIGKKGQVRTLYSRHDWPRGGACMDHFCTIPHQETYK